MPQALAGGGVARGSGDDDGPDFDAGRAGGGRSRRPPPGAKRDRLLMKGLLRFFGFLFAAGTILFVVGVAAVAGVIWHFSKDLPDYSQLQDYEPPVMTRVHAADGSLLAEYARERRLYIPIQAVPKLVIDAFLAAEDKNFYEHGGLDFIGIARAAHRLCREFRQRTPPAGRFHHHPTSRQELLVDERGFALAQGQGGAAGAEDRAHLFQGQDPRALLERDLSRPRRLWRRLRLAHLFRQEPSTS